MPRRKPFHMTNRGYTTKKAFFVSAFIMTMSVMQQLSNVMTKRPSMSLLMQIAHAKGSRVSIVLIRLCLSVSDSICLSVCTIKPKQLN